MSVVKVQKLIDEYAEQVSEMLSKEEDIRRLREEISEISEKRMRLSTKIKEIAKEDIKRGQKIRIEDKELKEEFVVEVKDITGGGLFSIDIAKVIKGDFKGRFFTIGINTVLSDVK